MFLEEYSEDDLYLDALVKLLNSKHKDNLVLVEPNEDVLKIVSSTRRIIEQIVNDPTVEIECEQSQFHPFTRASISFEVSSFEIVDITKLICAIEKSDFFEITPLTTGVLSIGITFKNAFTEITRENIP